jgi:hypothetical protein
VKIDEHFFELNTKKSADTKAQKTLEMTEKEIKYFENERKNV